MVDAKKLEKGMRALFVLRFPTQNFDEYLVASVSGFCPDKAADIQKIQKEVTAILRAIA